MNKNLTLTKKETVVLFDMLGLSDIPCSIGDMPAVTSHEYTDISRALYDMQAVCRVDDSVRPDKGFDPFFLPIRSADRILMFNYGEDGIYLFNASIYFSDKGVVAVKEKNLESIEFMPVYTLGELILLLPAVEDASQKRVSHFSYWLFDKNIGQAHCALINPSTRKVKLTESVKKGVEAQAQTTDSTMTLSEYAALFKKRMKEICYVLDR